MVSRYFYYLSVVLFLGSPLASVQAASYSFTDSFGRHFFDEVPTKVVITDWTLADQLIPLGIAPIGMPEIEAYQNLIGRPALPKDMVDIGKRRQLDIDKIKSLNPDVIILGTQQKFYEQRLAPIAYVNFFQSFSMHYRRVGEKARERFLQMAKMFKVEQKAKDYLAAFDAEMADNKKALANAFVDKKMPRVAIFRYAIDGDVLVYGENSLAGYVLRQLGLENAYDGRTSQFGDKRMSLNDMLELEADIYCYIAPRDGILREAYAMTDAQISSKMQQQNAALCQLPKVNSYGGVPSMRFMQDDIKTAVMHVAESKD